jgi:acetyl-CoA acetyltransferase
MSTGVSIVGAGLQPFGRHPGVSALDLGAEAARRAIVDAGAKWSEVGSLFVGALEISNPEALVARLGLTGVPARSVFNGCATGNTSMYAAVSAVERGEADIALAVGLDKHPRGAFSADPAAVGLPDWYSQSGLFLTTQFFGLKATRYCHDHGITPRTLARVAAKNLRNGAANPTAWRRTPMSEDEILDAAVLNYPLTQYMYCGPNEGAAAVLVCRNEIADRFNGPAVEVLSTSLRSRREGAFELMTTSFQRSDVPSVTVDASQEAFEAAAVGPDDVDVIQLQDTDAGSEVIHMAENGFCADGDQEKLIADGQTEITGTMPVNTDGGLIANGEPVGASGLRQIHELVLQLRGRADGRQVAGDPQVGYAHLYGAPGTAAVTILRRR